MYFWIHLALAIILTAYFLWRFLKDRLTYQILFVIWVPATLLTYIPFIGGNHIFRIILGAFQLVMFLLVLFFMFRKEPKKNTAGSSEEAVDANTSDSTALDKEPPKEALPTEAKQNSVPEEDIDTK